MAEGPVITPDTDWRERREKAGLSLRELARQSGVPAPTLSLIERRRMFPTLGQAEAVLDALSDSDGTTDRDLPGRSQRSVVPPAPERFSAGADPAPDRGRVAPRPGRPLNPEAP
jgi:transcriptional regulator with XRE-family HTH domain